MTRSIRGSSRHGLIEAGNVGYPHHRPRRRQYVVTLQAANPGKIPVLPCCQDSSMRASRVEMSKGDHEDTNRLNAEYDVTVIGPSLADRLGLS